MGTASSAETQATRNEGVAINTERIEKYPGGGVELGQDEEDVLLPRLESSVLKASVVQLVPEGEERR